MLNIAKKFYQEENGASAAEYALILAIVSGAIVTAAIALSGQIESAIAEVGCIIQSDGATPVASASGTSYTCAAS